MLFHTFLFFILMPVRAFFIHKFSHLHLQAHNIDTQTKYNVYNYHMDQGFTCLYKSYHSVKVFFVINKRLYSLIQNIKYNLIKLKLYHGIPFFQVCTKFVFTHCNVPFHFLHEDHPLFKILKSNVCFLDSTFINESLCQN